MSINFWDTGWRETGPQNAPVGFNKLYADNEWDTVKLGGYQLPGLCEVESKSTRLLDKKQKKGSNGATLTYTGYAPAEVIVRCHVWTAAQFADLQITVAAIWPRGTKAPPKGGLSIYHPALALWGIQQVLLHECDTPKPGRCPGASVFTFRFTELVPYSGTSRVKGSGTVTGVQTNAAFQSVQPANYTPAVNSSQPAPSKTDGGTNQSLPSRGASGSW